MDGNYALTYNVDIVFCIDATGSMQHIIDIVKENALNLYDDIERTMSAKHKVISGLRVRVIAFRDYLADGEKAMLTSEFFTLPAQAADLKECVQYIRADGGGDIPEDGLEALAYAMRSDWNKEGMRKRHIIVLWTDAESHPIGFGKESPHYPDNMAASFEELSMWWGDPQNTMYMDHFAKRLLMFAPDAKEWSTIRDTWDNVILAPVTSKEGLKELDYQEVLSAICNSI